MHDLATINKLNAEAIGRNIPAWRAAGKWVVAEYAGLSFVDAKPYDTEGQARVRQAELHNRNQPGESYQVLEPTAVPGDGIQEGQIQAMEAADEPDDDKTEADAENLGDDNETAVTT
jgi:predicted methyltransferase